MLRMTVQKTCKIYHEALALFIPTTRGEIKAIRQYIFDFARLVHLGNEVATYIWNLAATKGSENPTTRKVVKLIATGSLRVGPEGKGTVAIELRSKQTFVKMSVWNVTTLQQDWQCGCSETYATDEKMFKAATEGNRW